jgi:hypothetical protein
MPEKAIDICFYCGNGKAGLPKMEIAKILAAEPATPTNYDTTPCKTCIDALEFNTQTGIPKFVYVLIVKDADDIKKGDPVTPVAASRILNVYNTKDPALVMSESIFTWWVMLPMAFSKALKKDKPYLADPSWKIEQNDDKAIIIKQSDKAYAIMEINGEAITVKGKHAEIEEFTETITKDSNVKNDPHHICRSLSAVALSYLKMKKI